MKCGNWPANLWGFASLLGAVFSMSGKEALCFRVPSVWFVKLAIIPYVLYNLISYSLTDCYDTCNYDMNSFIWHFLNIVAVLYIFVFSWKLKRYLKLQNSNWIKFSNWPWCPVYWPWCPEKLSNIQGQIGLAFIFPNLRPGVVLKELLADIVV